MSFKILRTGTLLSIILFIASVGTAQTWRKMIQFPTAMYSAYFWDVNHGVVGGLGAIWHYNNGSWTTPAQPAEGPGAFRTLDLLGSNALYAGSGDSSVWVSTDSGASWQATSMKVPFPMGVYMTK